jgi:sigma-B regulation protein RsbU (phosphoserine phosphatase)
MGLFSKKAEGDPAAGDRPTSRLAGKPALPGILQDLEAGAEYQRGLMPQQAPEIPGYDLAYFFKPARSMSGDFFDFLPVEGGQTGIVVCDASGKGIPASLLAVMCQLCFRAKPDSGASPAATLASVNAMLHGNCKRGTFLTGIYAVLDPARHTLSMANAGHLPAVLWHSRMRIATAHRSNGPVLGVLAPAMFNSSVNEESVALAPGDRFVFFTDGMNEAMAPGQKEFGMEHLRKRLMAQSDGPSADFLRDLTSQLELHAGGGEQSDDITIVTGRRLPA